MLPLLRLAADQGEHSLREAIAFLSDAFQLSEQEKSELLGSGRQGVMANRVYWSGTHLRKALLLEQTRRGYFRITGRGLELLSENPPKVDIRLLERYPEFVVFRNLKHDKTSEEPEPELPSTQTRTPAEAMELAYQQLRGSLAEELLATLKNCTAEQFEIIVVDLLVKMGYGGTRRDAGQALGRSGDGGIDGIIKEDRLGLDAIYIQAKKWAETNGVGRPEIQKFAGALQGHRARKGVFITTSYFTKEAEDYVTRIDSKIVLIDGETLARKQGLRGQLWDDRDLHLTQTDPPDERGRSNRKSCAKLLDLQHLGLG
jgi:restriction system protein